MELERLATWIKEQVPGVDGVRIDGADKLELGHSAEMLLLQLLIQRRGGEEPQDVVVKLRPRSPGLLEPYDMGRQFEILRALEPTEVRAPRPLWFEPTGEVLGRELYVMERLPGDVYERVVPDSLDADPTLIPRMCESLIDQLATIHRVDLQLTGLDRIGDPSTFVDRQLDHWESEMRRVQRGRCRHWSD